jgi:zinc/manganese transport system substrate-binding protein
MIHADFLLLGALALGGAHPPPPAGVLPDTLRVVATLPDLADIVEQIGGERVEVTALTRGRENLHSVSARPSHLVALSRAQMFVQVGLSLEMAFVPGLLQGARNEAVQPGAPGFVNVSEGWQAIDVPTSVSRQGGDLHAQGNPHLNLDPRAGRVMAKAIHDGLVRVDAASHDHYDARLRDYLAKLEQAETRWAEQGRALRGRKVVVYHVEYDYFARHYGMEVVGSIELRPGIPPTPNHLARLIADMKAGEVGVILTAAWSHNNDVRRVAEATGARVVELPNQAGGQPGAESWIGMMDLIHARVLEAFAESPRDG